MLVCAFVVPMQQSQISRPKAHILLTIYHILPNKWIVYIFFLKYCTPFSRKQCRSRPAGQPADQNLHSLIHMISHFDNTITPLDSLEQMFIYIYFNLFFDPLHPSQEFFSHIWMISKVEPLLSNKDKEAYQGYFVKMGNIHKCSLNFSSLSVHRACMVNVLKFRTLKK